MSGLVAALVGLAALFAERGVAHARRARVGRRVLPSPEAEAAPRGDAAAAGRRIRGWRRARVRRALLDEQLADAVRGLAAAMRAGMSVPQALAYVADEAEPPLAGHLSAVVGKIETGVPMAEALGEWGASVGTDDATLVAAALDLHRRAGGDLPVVLEQVGATIRQRVDAAREIRALTAQARLSGLILGLLPLGFFAFLWLASRRDMEAALGSPAGLIAVVLGLVMEGGAFFWIRSLLAVER